MRAGCLRTLLRRLLKKLNNHSCLSLYPCSRWVSRSCNSAHLVTQVPSFDRVSSFTDTKQPSPAPQPTFSISSSSSSSSFLSVQICFQFIVQITWKISFSVSFIVVPVSLWSSVLLGGIRILVAWKYVLVSPLLFNRKRTFSNVFSSILQSSSQKLSQLDGQLHYSSYTEPPMQLSVAVYISRVQLVDTTVEVARQEIYFNLLFFLSHFSLYFLWVIFSLNVVAQYVQYVHAQFACSS